MTIFPAPLILDFDDSVLPLCPDEFRIPLKDWQECIRYSARWKNFRSLESHLLSCLPDHYGPVFLGSGDFHHLTSMLLACCVTALSKSRLPVDLIICDNHPDNMRYPFGIHCGSWVSYACSMLQVRQVHVIGISSGDIGWAHAFENRLLPLLLHKLTYWSVNQSAGWLKVLGLGECHRNFTSADALLEEFLPATQKSRNIYLSIDKDVLSKEEVQTNWDQGSFTKKHLEKLITHCSSRLIGADICGDVSEYTYLSRFKRLLSHLDGQKTVPPQLLHEWQTKQQALNIELLSWLRKAMS